MFKVYRDPLQEKSNFPGSISNISQWLFLVPLKGGR